MNSWQNHYHNHRNDWALLTWNRLREINPNIRFDIEEDRALVYLLPEAEVPWIILDKKTIHAFESGFELGQVLRKEASEE